jgi:hypothetical protein
MAYKVRNQITRFQFSILIFACMIPIFSLLIGCGSSKEELAAVDYTPLPGNDWPVSNPENEGLNSILVAELYHNAADLEKLFGLLVVKNGQLVVLVDEPNMVVVVTADPFYLEHSGESWKHEKAHIKLVADFIASLPAVQ